MFIKLSFKYSDLILNTDNIISIQYTKPVKNEEGQFTGGWFIIMSNGDKYTIYKEHYEQICEILTKKL